MKKFKLHDGSGLCHSHNVNSVTVNEINLFEISKVAQVFRIDHILEEILTFVDFVTLKNCCLVQQNWAYCGAKEMKKRTKINLYFSKPWINEDICKTKRVLSKIPIHPCRRRPQPNIPKDNNYGELAILMMKAPTQFPCNSFKVHSHKLMSSPVQTFFNSVGIHVIKLTLAVQYPTLRYSAETTGSDVMECVKLLLTQQMPNLVYLKIKYFHRFHNPHVCNIEMEEWNLDTAKHIFDVDQQSKGQLLKLKTLIVDSVFPERGIKEILDMSPHLNIFSVKSQYLYHELGPILENFISGNGRFRIHLLTNLTFHPDDTTVPIFEKLLDKYSGTLKLTQFGFWNFDNEFNCTLPRFVIRVGNIVRHVLLSNSDILEKLSISPFERFGIKEISQMPKLKELSFEDCYLDIENEPYFPNGFSMAKTFPALKIIRMDQCELSLVCEGLDITKSVPSVELIVLPMPYYCSIPRSVRRTVATLFPNSTLVKKETR